MKDSEGNYFYSVKGWTPEIKQWLIDNTKGMQRVEAYNLFQKQFPELNKTLVAVSNMRSRLNCGAYSNPHKSTKQRPLYAEHCKKGYVYIKVAQPSVWIPKSKWVYLEYNPGAYNYVKETDVFIFLDGNNRNFNVDNIELVHRRELTIFIQMGGIVDGNPEATRINILQARLKLKQLDALEKIGRVSYSKSGRRDLDKLSEAMRNYVKKRNARDPEYRKNRCERSKRYYANMTPEQRQHRREYMREWSRKKRTKEKLINASNKNL